MVITDKFVFVHEPKTGGSFVRKVLDDFYRRERPRGVLSGALDVLTGGKSRRSPAHSEYRTLEKFHGTCHDIPEPDRGKPILSIVRNPFDLYVCFYYFGWWHTHPEDSYDDFGLVKEQYPRFPDLSFEEFLMLANTRFDDFKLIGHNDIPHDERPGWYTTRFIKYYFQNPEAVYPLIDDAYVEVERYREDMFDIHFMRTHRLNEDLYQYLLQAGFPSVQIEFILALDPVRPKEEAKKRPDGDWAKYYTPDLKAYVLKKEKLLFSLFPDLGAEDPLTPIIQ